MLYYIDPGTGSMLFTILIGAISASIYAIRSAAVKIKFKLNGGKVETQSGNEIPFAIFSDSKRYWNVFEPICDEFEKRGKEIVYLTASPDDPALEKEYEHVKSIFLGEGNKAFAKLNMLKADIVLSTTPGLDVYQWKRSKDVKHYAHILHAASDISMYRMFGIDYYDSLLLSGDFQVNQANALEACRNVPIKEKVLVGNPYVDAMKTRYDALEKMKHDDITVLLAPSWGKSGILNIYGDKIIDALIDTGYNIVVRPHPQSFVSEKEMIEGLMQKYPESDKFHWNRDNDNFEILNKSDILISDFSGVIFDFTLVFDKPIIYTDTEYDKSPYDACWLDEEPWTFRILPELGQKLTDEKISDIKNVIDSCIGDEKYKNGRDKARQESWVNQGHAAEAVADFLINKQKELVGE